MAKRKSRARGNSSRKDNSLKAIKAEVPGQIKYRLKPEVVRAAIALVIVLIGAFLIFSGIINIANRELQDSNSGQQEEQVDEENTQINNGKDKDGHKTSGISTERVNAATAAAINKAEQTANIIKKSGIWHATDYVKGEIRVGSYKVRKGDTLWEIADAVYGDGFKWRKILRKNRADIGFLPNGSQALIMPGQVLVIAK